jgi:hypothetical protein
MTPEIAKTYIFVRKRKDGFEHTEYTRHEDGSAGFLADGMYRIFECHPDAWRSALAALAEEGFVELGGAQISGLVPPEWRPTPETSTIATAEPLSIVPLDEDSGDETKKA